MTQEMKRHAVIVAIHAKRSNLEISQFLNVSRSFIQKVRRELETSDGNVESVAACRKINLVQTQLEHHSLCTKFMTLLMEILQTSISRNLQVCKYTIHHNVRQDIR